MALNTAVLDAALDSDGSPNSGEGVDKAFLYDIFVTPVNAEIARLDAAIAAGWSIATTSTLTGAQHNWAPGLSGKNTYVPWNGASDAAFTGITGMVAGQVVLVKNISTTKVMTFAHQSGSSSAGNKFRNYVTSAPTPVAPGGFIKFVSNGTDLILVGHEQGAWITATFAAGNFTALPTGTLTVDAGDVKACAYRVDGTRLTVQMCLDTMTLTGTPNYLTIGNAAWGGFTLAAANSSLFSPAYVYDTANVLALIVNPTTTSIHFTRLDGALFTAATNLLYARGTFIGSVL